MMAWIARCRVPLVLSLWLLGVALLLSACGAPPESPVALSEPGETAYDERLPGNWYFAEKDGAFHLHIAPRDEGALLDVIGASVDYDDGDPVQWIKATAHASVIDGETYYNVMRVAGAGFDYTAEGEAPGYITLGTELSDDGGLTLCFMGGLWGSKLNDLIKEDRAKGHEVKGRYGDQKVGYIVLDLSRPELVALIREVSSEKLFSCEVGPFRRLIPTVSE